MNSVDIDVSLGRTAPQQCSAVTQGEGNKSLVSSRSEKVSIRELMLEVVLCDLFLPVYVPLALFCAAAGQVPRLAAAAGSPTFLPCGFLLRACPPARGAAPALRRCSGGRGGRWLSVQHVPRGMSPSPSSENLLSRLSLGGHSRRGEML